MIESFGGRVTGSVSGKTSYLVVGKAPGAKKVMEAAAKGVPTVDVAGLKRVLEGGAAGASLEDAPPAHIGEFSKGAFVQLPLRFLLVLPHYVDFAPGSLQPPLAFSLCAAALPCLLPSENAPVVR